ncbi:MAG: hypothetical protein O7G83_03000 [Proteobacteria bacterium]|nr:hypothetical protein [Pseudomonadota bacterium]
MQPPDGMILEIGPRLKGYSVVFCAFGGGKKRKTGGFSGQFSPIHGARRSLTEECTDVFVSPMPIDERAGSDLA